MWKQRTSAYLIKESSFPCRRGAYLQGRERRQRSGSKRDIIFVNRWSQVNDILIRIHGIAGCTCTFFYLPGFNISIPVPFIFTALNINKGSDFFTLRNIILINLITPLCHTYFSRVFAGCLQNEILLLPGTVLTFS